MEQESSYWEFQEWGKANGAKVCGDKETELRERDKGDDGEGDNGARGRATETGVCGGDTSTQEQTWTAEIQLVLTEP